MTDSFFITLRQLVVPAGVPECHLPGRAVAKLGIPEKDILSCQPVRRSLDARKRRGRAVYVYHLRLEIPAKHRRQLRKANDANIVFEQSQEPVVNLTDPRPPASTARPLVVGAGPAGLFAALRLARAGWNPLLIERGDAVADRRSVVAAFWRSGLLDTESNALFGEGGAGLFSDGKLNTRHKDRQGMDEILRLMVEAGAPDRIRIDATPHVGSDLLGDMVARLADDIRACGGEIRYQCALASLIVDNGKLTGAVLRSNGKDEAVSLSACVMATGHSARDVHTTLTAAGARLESKPFAIGLRVEMPQDQVDASQRGGSFSPAPGEAASFRLSRAPEGDAAACYTFCMCPGGLVIACASEPEMLCVNGMSFHARAGEYANAAFLTPVADQDFNIGDEPVDPALAGVEFQRYWERKAYQAGRAGGEYAVPASSLCDFVAGTSGVIPEGRSVGRACSGNLREILPDHIGRTLAQSIPAMVARLRQVDPERVVVYGVETRTSSPVRVVRDTAGESVGLSGLFPAGEGSGYAGGIMTSALDGWKAAGAFMRVLAKA